MFRRIDYWRRRLWAGAILGVLFMPGVFFTVDAAFPPQLGWWDWFMYGNNAKPRQPSFPAQLGLTLSALGVVYAGGLFVVARQSIKRLYTGRPELHIKWREPFKRYSSGKGPGHKSFMEFLVLLLGREGQTYPWTPEEIRLEVLKLERELARRSEPNDSAKASSSKDDALEYMFFMTEELLQFRDFLKPGDHPASGSAKPPPKPTKLERLRRMSQQYARELEQCGDDPLLRDFCKRHWEDKMQREMESADD